MALMSVEERLAKAADPRLTKLEELAELIRLARSCADEGDAEGMALFLDDAEDALDDVRRFIDPDAIPWYQR